MAYKLYIRLISLLVFCLFPFAFARAQGMGNWSNTGPTAFPTNVSGQIHGIGRVSQIKFHPTNSSKVYAVSASGGAYLSSNNGVSWSPISGTQTLPQTSLSSICINHLNDRTLYICLGDANYFSNSYGIYKSVDGGASWAAANSTVGTSMAVEILMDPTDTNKLVAATRGGIYRTTNGGASWTQTQAGTFRDMKAKPVANGQTLYAATATAFYVSTNFGSTWTAITSGLTIPSGNGGMRIAVSPADTNRVYVATTHGNGVVFKSTNSGTSFTTVYNSTSQCITCYTASTTSGSQYDYDFDITSNPTNANELLLVAHAVWRSTDGGTTWSQKTNWWANVHTDMHQIDWNPYNNAQIWTANDGGVWMSTDTLAATWSPRSDGLGATEVYHAAQSPVVRDLISIGTQDNGELYYTAGAWKTNRGGDWTPPCAIDYRGSGTVWYPARGNRRNLLPLGSDQSFNPPFSTNSGTFIQSDPTRVEFVRGLPALAFAGSTNIYRCTNINATSPTWQSILTNSSNIRDIESCSADSNILYVAAVNGTLYRSDNALAATPTWTTLTTPGSVSSTGSITTSRANSQVVFMACNNQVYRSTNKGVSWTNITGSGLSGLNIRKIIHDDYSTKQRLFVNAGAYVHYKDSTTTAWTNHSANVGLPTVANGSDFMIYNDGTASSILRLSTFGRGVWECDINANVAPVADFTSDKIIACPGDTVHFSHLVNGSFTSLSWSFSGGNPSTSSAVSPAIVYTTPGTYAVQLTATNPWGTNTATKTAYITVTKGQTSPITEGFENSTYPPAGWYLTTTSNWLQTGVASGYSLSSKCIVWDNYNTDGAGIPDALVAPKVDLTGISAAKLKFDVAYAPYDINYVDTLRIRLSTDCGQTWNVIYNKGGSTLGTTSALTTSVFVPVNWQWRTDSISLAAYAGNSIMLSFEDIGHYGQALYLDNINVTVGPSSRFGASPTKLCAGSTVSFTDSSVNAQSWSWSFPGGTPASATTPNVTVTYATAGSYTATLTTTNATGSSTTQIPVTVGAIPAPVITGNGSFLSTSAPAGSGFQWYLNGAPITGATDSTYQAPADSGTYTVVVTSPEGCTGTSAAYIKLGIGNTLRGAGYELFPNPNKGVFTIKSGSIKADEVTVTCFDATGRQLRQEVLKLANNRLRASIDWSSLPRGVYTVSVRAHGLTAAQGSIIIQ
jgi:PKD repeat protein